MGVMKKPIQAVDTTPAHDGQRTTSRAPVDSRQTKSSSQAVTDGTPTRLDLRVEALLMSADRPYPAAKLAGLLGQSSVKLIQDAVSRLNQVYADTGRSFRIEQVAKGWQILTLPDFSELLATALKNKTATRLSPAALEAVAIIAYKQPILRADIEAIRGVASGEVIRGLMDRRLVKIVGRAEELGRPMLYGTTQYFLEVFGLASLKDLPKVEELWHKAHG